MRDEPVYLVTDQGAATGTGAYVAALMDLLGKTYPNLTVLSLCYLPGQEQPGWKRLPHSRVARSLHEIPLVIRHNRLLFQKTIPHDSRIHFCGASYTSVPAYTRSIVTVHDYYPRWPSFLSLGNARMLLRDVAALKQYVQLPRQSRYARARVVPTHYVQECLYHGCSLPSIVIHHWTEASKFFPRDKRSARASLGLPLNQRLVLNVSTGTSNKNYPQLANIASDLSEGYQLVIGGGHGSLGEIKGTFLPRLADEVYPLLFNACDAYLHLSTQEGFGRPLIQAMASGLPIVALRTAVAKEVLGDAAIWVGPDEPVSRWVESLESAAEGASRDDLIARGGKRALLFDPESARRAYTELYQEVFGL